ncbi:MAG: response regulator [Bacteroidales bacterium]|nr:response regulator [Bacteroidales bacterium]
MTVLKNIQRILLIESTNVDLSEISSLLIDSNYIIDNVKNIGEAIFQLHKSFYNIIISNIKIKKTITIVKSIREYSEYSFTPILIISSEIDETQFLDLMLQGADDFLIKPFNEKFLFSKITLLLKKSELKKGKSLKTQNRGVVGIEEGEILYCVKNQSLSPQLLPDDFRIRSIFNSESLFSSLQNNTIWLVLVDQDADWALDISEKIKQSLQDDVPLLFLLDNEHFHLASFIADGYILRNLSDLYIINQLRFLIERERSLKNKYVNALQLATHKTAFSFSRNTERTYDNYKLSVIYEPYDQMGGGDFYEIIPVSANKVLIFVGDIMGKAWEAWFFVPAYIAYIRSVIRFLSLRSINKTFDYPAKILETTQ